MKNSTKTHKKEFHAIIFDMDGVLIDSLDTDIKSHKLFLKQYGITHIKQDEESTLGRSMKDKIKIWSKKNKLYKKVDPDFFIREVTKIQIKIFRKTVKTNRSLLRLLEEAKSDGIKLAVATSSTGSRARSILKILKIRKYFRVLVSADDVSHSKPDPHIYLLAAKKINEDPKNCVVFEDAGNGVIAAKRAGMKCIGKRTKHEKLINLKRADKIIRSFAEINIEKIKKIF